MSATEKRPSLIVLAEDNPRDVSLIKMSLSTYEVDYTLVTIDDGERAIHYFDQLERDETAIVPDLMILDINLPKQSGKQILTRIRQSRRSSRTPVLVVTSSDSKEDREMARVQGASFFQKVADLDSFMKVGGIVKDLLSSGSALGGHKASAKAFAAGLGDS